LGRGELHHIEEKKLESTIYSNSRKRKNNGAPRIRFGTAVEIAGRGYITVLSLSFILFSLYTKWRER
jgi:hypothetical protein